MKHSIFLILAIILLSTQKLTCKSEAIREASLLDNNLKELKINQTKEESYLLSRFLFKGLKSKLSNVFIKTFTYENGSIPKYGNIDQNRNKILSRRANVDDLSKQFFIINRLNGILKNRIKSNDGTIRKPEYQYDTPYLKKSLENPAKISLTNKLSKLISTLVTII